MAKRGTQEWINNLKNAKPRKWTKFLCDYCKCQAEDKPSHYLRKKHHFCSSNCYARFRSEMLHFTEANSYKGIRKSDQTKYVYHRRYAARNPKRIAHLKARRYARERNAQGSHTLEEWEKLCLSFGNRCSFCKKLVKLTRDHIIPLSEGGTDWISNIQPLCRNCNSKKWCKLNYRNPELLKQNHENI